MLRRRGLWAAVGGWVGWWVGGPELAEGWVGWLVIE